MPATTATTLGAEFSRDHHIYDVCEFIYPANYDAATGKTVVAALFAALCTEVDNRLPDGVHWQPATAEFIHPVDFEMPDVENMRHLFARAWLDVMTRYPEIAAEALSATGPETD